MRVLSLCSPMTRPFFTHLPRLPVKDPRRPIATLLVLSLPEDETVSRGEIEIDIYCVFELATSVSFAFFPALTPTT